MKSRPSTASGAGTPTSCGGSGRSHSKRGSASRERDKFKVVASGESGGSSQCDTPPLNEKEWSSGKLAGVSGESVLCAAEGLGGPEMTAEAAAALAEDTSFKLRQLIHSIWTRSQTCQHSRITTSDVNTVLKLMDTEPVLGPNPPNWQSLKPAHPHCYEPDSLVYPIELALDLTPYTPKPAVALSTRWVCEERAIPAPTDVPSILRTYCINVSKALLKGTKKMKSLVLSDLATNTRVGPIIPNLLNLAVLVLNDDNLNTLLVPVKEPLKCVILDMIKAICANPCSLDTDVFKQLQRLYPALVADILNSGVLADKMISVMTQIANTWPAFLHIGEKTLYDYVVSDSSRLTACVVRCLCALGRRALLSCLEPHLEYIDECIQAQTHNTQPRNHLTGAFLDASSLLLRYDGDCWLEDYLTIDYSLYEILGDAIMPRQIQSLQSGYQKKEHKLTEYQPDDDSYVYGAVSSRGFCLRVLPARPTPGPPADPQFTRQALRPARIVMKIAGSRPRAVAYKLPRAVYNASRATYTRKVIVATGKLARFKYKLPKREHVPIFAGYLL